MLLSPSEEKFTVRGNHGKVNSEVQLTQGTVNYSNGLTASVMLLGPSARMVQKKKTPRSLAYFIQTAQSHIGKICRNVGKQWLTWILHNYWGSKQCNGTFSQSDILSHLSSSYMPLDGRPKIQHPWEAMMYVARGGSRERSMVISFLTKAWKKTLTVTFNNNNNKLKLFTSEEQMLTCIFR